MRHFQNLLEQLKTITENRRPGDSMEPPALLQFVESDGRRIYYSSMGSSSQSTSHSTRAQRHGHRKMIENQPIVLVHGFGGFFMDWPRVMAPLARHTQVYAIDLPGWGFSDPNYEARSIEDDVAAVRTLIQKLGLSNVIVCGLSYGAGVAWAAAAMHLPRVSEVVLLNPMPPHPLTYMRSFLYRAIFLMSSTRLSTSIGHKVLQKSHYKLICKESLLNFRLLDSFYFDLAYKIIKQPKVAHNLHQQARGARDIDWNGWEHRLASVRIPVTILQATGDRIFSLESARYLQKLIPGSKLIEVPKCGHAMVFDQHRKVSEFLIGLLATSKLKSDTGT